MGRGPWSRTSVGLSAFVRSLPSNHVWRIDLSGGRSPPLPACGSVLPAGSVRLLRNGPAGLLDAAVTSGLSGPAAGATPVRDQRELSASAAIYECARLEHEIRRRLRSGRGAASLAGLQARKRALSSQLELMEGLLRTLATPEPPIRRRAQRRKHHRHHNQQAGD